VLDVILNVLMRASERRAILQYDATFLTPNLSLQTNGAIGSLVPGVPPERPPERKVPLASSGGLGLSPRQPPAAVLQSACTGSVSEDACGILGRTDDLAFESGE
jgi:hypothetical protein